MDLPLERIYYPVGLATDATAQRLFVVNSDFDLQFNAGSVQSLSLERIRESVPRECAADTDCRKDERCDLTGEDGAEPSYWCVAVGAKAPCGSLGDRPLEDQVQSPGRCGALRVTKPQDGGKDLLVDVVEIRAFASDVIFRSEPGATEDRGRLFIPVRGDSTLHWMNVQDGKLDCGQGRGRACAAKHRVGERPAGGGYDSLTMPSEPSGIATSDDGSLIVVTHESVDRLSLFTNNWGADGGPSLEYVSDELDASPVGIAVVPPDRAGDGVRFLVGFRGLAELQTLECFEDESMAPREHFLKAVESSPIDANYSGADSRGIAIDSSDRDRCLASCSDDDACAACLDVQRLAYIANRAPSSLLIAGIGSAGSDSAAPVVRQSLSVPYGPSRVVLGNVVTEGGELAPRVFIVSFDARRIGVYDPAVGDFERWIETGRGPHALLVDSGFDSSGDPYALAYVAHFTDSYIGVVQLDQRQRHNYGETVLTVGEPTEPRGST